jgi:phospholipase/carboxylesterase
LPVRFVFPHAPIRPVTVNGGYEMRAWFDILGFDRTAHQDNAGIQATNRILHTLIEQEKSRGIKANRIILAGFSQGAAMALHCGLRYPERLAGIIALSGYLPVADTLAAEISPANQSIPIFLAHGSFDGIIPVAWAELARDTLQTRHYAVDWKLYPMEHGVCPAEIKDISHWLQTQLKT